MNIIDVFNNLEKSTENTVSNKIAKRSEEKEIECFADKVVDDIIRQISYKFKGYENSNKVGPYCNCYNCDNLSDEDKNLLKKKLEEQVKTIPSKLSVELSKIFGISTEEKESENKEEKAAVETETSDSSENNESETSEANNVATVSTQSIFGY